MKIEEVSQQDFKSNWILETSIELLFKSLSESERENIWSDGKFYAIGDKYYLVYRTIDGTSYDRPIACLMTTKTVITPKSNTILPSKTADCLTIFVHPDFRKRNIATWLIERAIRKSWCEVLMAKVKRQNDASFWMFKNLGFHEVGENDYEWMGCPDHKVLLCDR